MRSHCIAVEAVGALLLAASGFSCSEKETEVHSLLSRSQERQIRSYATTGHGPETTATICREILPQLAYWPDSQLVFKNKVPPEDETKRIHDAREKVWIALTRRLRPEWLPPGGPGQLLALESSFLTQFPEPPESVRVDAFFANYEVGANKIRLHVAAADAAARLYVTPFDVARQEFEKSRLVKSFVKECIRMDDLSARELHDYELPELNKAGIYLFAGPGRVPETKKSLAIRVVLAESGLGIGVEPDKVGDIDWDTTPWTEIPAAFPGPARWNVFSDLRDVRKLMGTWGKQARKIAEAMPFEPWEAQIHSISVEGGKVWFDMAVRTRASTRSGKEEALRGACRRIERGNTLLRNVEFTGLSREGEDLVWVARGEFTAHLAEAAGEQEAR